MLKHHLKPRILFFTVHLAFFVSHRLELALAARQRGYDVKIVVGLPADREMTKFAEQRMRQEELDYTVINVNSRSINIIKDFFGIIKYFKIAKTFKPDIVHSISSKPIIISNLLSKFFKYKSINAVSGLGHTNGSKITSFINIPKLLKLSAIYARSHIIVQNLKDKTYMETEYNRTELFLGSGVDHPSKNRIRKKNKSILFSARLLYSKGIIDFLEVAKIFHEMKKDWTFVVAGSANYDHPDALKKAELARYLHLPNVRFLGYVEKMDDILSDAKVMFFPSKYGEGLSKSLIEGVAYGCVTITFDRPGCAEVVNLTDGYLLPEELSYQQQADAILQILKNEEELEKVSYRCHERSLKIFGKKVIIEQHMKLYEELSRFAHI